MPSVKVKVKVEVYDDAIHQILPTDATAEQLAAGFGFTEGPVWCSNYFLFSDIPRNRIVRLRQLAEGPEVTTFRYPSGPANGLTLDGCNRLIACEIFTRRVTFTELDGTIKVLADRYQGKRLNSPNDVVVRSDGSVYFTDPSWLPPEKRELPFKGVYRVAPDGEVHLLIDDFGFPNGLAFSPDENTLYIADSFRDHIRAFDVNPDGSIKNGRILIDMTSTRPGVVDGFKIDQQGNIYSTGRGGLWIISPSGKCLAIVKIPVLASNIAWGDSDWKSLYMTCFSSIYRMRLNIPGIPVPIPVREE
ncbi:Gluconolactonase [subsurface metagenome]